MLTHQGWPANHDLLAPLSRMAAVLGQWKAGHWLPVWSTHLQFGFGSPVPALYHKTFMYLSAAVLGLTGSAKAAMVLPLFAVMVGGFCGMCYLLRQALQGRHPWLWLAGGAALLMSNYFTTDWLVRGAFAEATAMMVIPWMLAWCLTLVGRGTWAVWIGPVVALLALSHSTLALFGLLPLGLALLLALLRWRSAGLGWFRPALLSGALCGALLLPFVLPMAALSRFNQIEQLTHAPDFTPRANGWPWQRYFWDPQWTWGQTWTSYTVQLDLVTLALVPLCLLLVLWPREASAQASGSIGKASSRWMVAYLVAVLLVMGWLQTSWAYRVYEVVPGAQYLQFAWRLLAYVTVCLIACAAIGLSELARAGGPARRTTMGLAACGACVMVAWAAYPKLWWHELQYDWYAPAQFKEELASSEYAAFGEFLPLVDWRNPPGLAEVASSAKVRLAVAAAVDPCALQSRNGIAPPQERRSGTWGVTCAGAAQVPLPVFLAPGMQARIRADARQPWTEAVPHRTCSDPRLHIDVPAGTWEVEVRFPSWSRVAAAAFKKADFDFRRGCAGAAPGLVALP